MLALGNFMIANASAIQERELATEDIQRVMTVRTAITGPRALRDLRANRSYAEARS